MSGGRARARRFVCRVRAKGESRVGNGAVPVEEYGEAEKCAGTRDLSHRQRIFRVQGRKGRIGSGRKACQPRIAAPPLLHICPTGGSVGRQVVSGADSVPLRRSRIQSLGTAFSHSARSSPPALLVAGLTPLRPDKTEPRTQGCPGCPRSQIDGTLSDLHACEPRITLPTSSSSTQHILDSASGSTRADSTTSLSCSYGPYGAVVVSAG